MYERVRVIPAFKSRRCLNGIDWIRRALPTKRANRMRLMWSSVLHVCHHRSSQYIRVRRNSVNFNFGRRRRIFQAFSNVINLDGYASNPIIIGIDRRHIWRGSIIVFSVHNHNASQGWIINVALIFSTTAFSWRQWGFGSFLWEIWRSVKGLEKYVLVYIL